MKLFLIVSFLTGIITANDDPCSIAKRLPSLELRLKAYKINPNRDTALCDRYLINHPGEWFRSEDGNEMVNNATERNECGTDYGIYMIGTVPSVADGNVTRKACLPTLDCNTTNYDIILKNCGLFTAYYLKRPDSCDQAYCFGFGESGVPPSVATGKPEVKFELENNTVEKKQHLVFKCDFARVDENNPLFYRVFWFINNYKSAIYISQAVPFHEMNFTYLRHSTGLSKIKFNVQISCFTRLYYNPNASPGPSSERSEKFFAGLETEAKSYTIKNGSDDPIYINFRLTVPFGCEIGEDRKVKNCKLWIELTSPGDETCDQGLQILGQCGKEIKQSEWNNIQSIAVKHKNVYSRGAIKSSEINLLSNVEVNGELFWDEVRIPKIHIHFFATSPPEARCSAQSDPHMLSFMGTRYENQMDGTFTFYKYIDSYGNTNEIQMKVRKCTTSNYCTCAIAARAASDIYVIDRCDDDKAKWRFDFINCKEDILHVVKKKNNEFSYEIHFHTGSYLEVAFGKINNVYTLELFMNPTDFDTSAMGLCGRVELGHSRPLYSPTMQDLSSDHEKFVTSWKVADKDNMLTLPVKELDTIYNETYQPHKLCICNKTNPSEGGILEELTCTNAKEYAEPCGRENEFSPVKKGTCVERHNRKKRSTKHFISYLPDNFVTTTTAERAKRSTKVVMTKAEAESWCEDYMTQSPGYVACKDVPNTNPERAVEICVLDILATNSTDWATIPREGLKAACMKELIYNDILNNDIEEGVSIAQKIKAVTCPLECSGNGKCLNGTCECDKDFGAGDCSINLNDPPLVFAINRETGGLCDRNFCNEAIVIGDLFLNRPDLMCKMQRFQLNHEGKRMVFETTHMQGVHNTIGDIRCNFPHLMNRRSVGDTEIIAFITGYEISISNNNRNFSVPHMMYILDSTCQDTINVSGELKFVLKPGYCFIHGSCITAGYVIGCNSCNPMMDPFDWTFNVSDKACSNKTSSLLWIIGVVLAFLLAPIVILLVIIWKKKYRSTTVRDVSIIPRGNTK